MSKTNYRKYVKFNLNLDPADKEDAEIIKYLQSKKSDTKVKNSYGAVIKKAVREMMKKENEDIEA